VGVYRLDNHSSAVIEEDKAFARMAQMSLVRMILPQRHPHDYYQYNGELLTFRVVATPTQIFFESSYTAETFYR
jgi:hypothetical protein